MPGFLVALGKPSKASEGDDESESTDSKSLAWKALVRALKDDDEEAGLEAFAELSKPAEAEEPAEPSED